MIRGLKLLRKNTLLTNAIYLMLSTFVVAASGFLFWVIVTKQHSTEAVGLATTMLSVSGLLSLLGLAGFDTTFVRFLPGSKRRSDYVSSGFIIITGISVLLATATALLLPVVSPNLALLKHPWTAVAFVFFTAASALNIVTNAVFLAFKRAKYIFVINTLFSAFKVFLPLVVVDGSAVVIFVLAGLAQLLGLVLSVAWMYRRLGYRFSPVIHVEAIRAVRKFSQSVYASSILNLLPPTLLPLLVIHFKGPANAAYYYMAFTIATVLYTVAYAAMQSVFAEGSHDEDGLGRHMKRAAKVLGALLLPATLVTILFSHVLLTAFGHEYAQHADTLLKWFAAGALPVAVYSGLGANFKVTKNLRGIIWMNTVYAVTILGSSYVFLPRLGLVAVGWAWLFGNLAACLTGMLFIVKKERVGYG